MKSRFLFVVSALLAGGLASAAQKKSEGADASPVATGDKSRGLEVLINADAAPLPEGFRPKSGQPIHYIFSQSRASLGEAIAGVKLPDPALVEKTIVAELAKQGFVRTAVGGPLPSIFIIAVVGDSNFEEPPMDRDDPDFRQFISLVNARPVLEKEGLGEVGRRYGNSEAVVDAAASSGDPDVRRAGDIIMDEARRLRYRASDRSKDKAKVVALVGGPKLERAVETKAMSRSDAEQMAWAAAENRLYVSLSAFDAARWVKKERVLLWRTSMLIDWRKDFASSLPTMLAQAGPLFGTDAAVPVLVDERDRRKGTVGIGELKVIHDAAEPAPKPDAKK